MIEIKENNVMDNIEDEITSAIISKLEKDGEACIYKAHYPRMSVEMARKICYRFIDKNYHAKINFFSINDNMQLMIVSKRCLSETNAMAVYSEVLG